MLVEMAIQIAGTRDGVRWPAPGGRIDLPDHEAKKLCAAQWATPVAETKPERAVSKKPETRKA